MIKKLKRTSIIIQELLILLFSFSINFSGVSNNFNSNEVKFLSGNSLVTQTTQTSQKNINEAISYYNEGLELYEFHELILAEVEFLKVIELAENSEEKEMLAFSFHYLGNIEGWKSNFTQSIHYFKKQRPCLKKYKILNI